MKILFRADASIDIGTGHVMRCLALANGLRAEGAQCVFLCRDHPGHLADVVRSAGHEVHLVRFSGAAERVLQPAHSAELGSSWEEDAAASINVARATLPNWLIVDHYGLDQAWERALHPFVGKIMVIDDLANRPHHCDMLLDQNLTRTAKDYDALVPNRTTVLTGSQHALLRPEFSQMRAQSLQRREKALTQNVLVTVGGVDRDNYTRRTLELMTLIGLQAEARIKVVLGAGAPWAEDVSVLAKTLPWPTEVIVQSNAMAELMKDADFAIGAAGSTTWERACLGLPSALWVVADNQRVIAEAMEEKGAALVLRPEWPETALVERLAALLRDPSALIHMSRRAAALVDGLGVDRVQIALRQAGSLS